MEKHNLTLSGLGRSFGSTRAVDGVSLDIAPANSSGSSAAPVRANRLCCGW